MTAVETAFVDTQQQLDGIAEIASPTLIAHRAYQPSLAPEAPPQDLQPAQNGFEGLIGY